MPERDNKENVIALDSASDVETQSRKLESFDELRVDKIIINTQQKCIFAVIRGVGRVCLARDASFPADWGVNKDSVTVALKAQVATGKFTK